MRGNGYQDIAQQKCLAHLRRHFKKLIQLPGLFISPFFASPILDVNPYEITPLS